MLQQGGYSGHTRVAVPALSGFESQPPRVCMPHRQTSHAHSHNDNQPSLRTVANGCPALGPCRCEALTKALGQMRRPPVYHLFGGGITPVSTSTDGWLICFVLEVDGQALVCRVDELFGRSVD